MLEYCKLDLESLQLMVYADFANLPHGKWQLGFLVCLTDSSFRCSISHFASSKSTRVAGSTMASESLAFVDGFDYAYLIKHDLKRLLSREIPLSMFTDCYLLFDALTRSRYTTERPLTIDIASARDAYHDGLIFNISLILSEYNPADSLTKIGSSIALKTLLHTHTLNHPVRALSAQIQVLSDLKRLKVIKQDNITLIRDVT